MFADKATLTVLALCGVFNYSFNQQHVVHLFHLKSIYPHALLWQKILNGVAGRSVQYKLLVTSINEEQMRGVQNRCYQQEKSRAHLAVSTPVLVMAAVVEMDWWNRHCMEQLVMVLKNLLFGGVVVKGLIRAQMMQHSLWLGGECGSGLGGPHNKIRGWDGTLLGRLHIWMTEMNLELKGGAPMPMHGRERDVLVHLTLKRGEGGTSFI